MSFEAPVEDLLFNIAHLALWPDDTAPDTEIARAVLTELGRFAAEEIAPLNGLGDRQGSRCEDGQVRTPDGFRQAYARFVEMGWQGLVHPEAFGGQDLPRAIGAASGEILNAANMSFALCPLLTDGAIEALRRYGSADMQAAYLPNLVSGRWTGTMNLTEPQAGSDLALLRTRAERTKDGSYRLSGTKIFITYGQHDLSENIVHLVLARTPDAPKGIRGISLFLAPKVLPDGSQNAIRCVSIEHKLGVHASPTCVLSYEGATGFLIGQENAGLDYMFTMMNAARFAVGVQGVAIAERALQQALAYARTRIQGRPVDGGANGAVAIIQHPDVRRMLGRMRALTEGCRAMAIFAASCQDRADRTGNTEAQAMAEFLVPLVKGFATEMAVEVTSLGVQVHGGMGFIEEGGAAQYLRDARISTIYEGTTGIQANDLTGRKVGAEKGATALALVAEMRGLDARLAAAGERFALMHVSCRQGIDALATATDWLVGHYREQPEAVAAVAVPYLKLFGTVAGGWLMARAALIAGERLAGPGADREFLEAKLATARFYIEHLLPQAAALSRTVTAGAASVLAVDPATL